MGWVGGAVVVVVLGVLAYVGWDVYSAKKA